jgi:hypothetical protein
VSTESARPKAALRGASERIREKSPKGNGMIRASKDFSVPPASLNNPQHRFEYAGKPMSLAKRYTGFDISGIPQ